MTGNETDMKILPINNISFCKKQEETRDIKKAISIINKKDGIDLFLDAYGELINKIKETEKQQEEFKAALAKTNIPQQQTILSTKIKSLDRDLKNLQSKRVNMEKIIHIIDRFATDDRDIEIVYVDRRGEDKYENNPYK